MMVLKRKRSSELFSSTASPSASSTSSDFSFFSPIPQHQAGQVTPLFWGSNDVSRNLFSGSRDMHSRTMKRVRDNRPSEDEIHQRTLNMLFNAQEQTQIQEPLPAPIEQDTLHSSQSTSATQQHSLHRFWNISSAPKAPTALPPQTSSLQLGSISCDDCGTPFGEDTDADMIMDDGSHNGQTTACGACGKNVCFGCSVSNLGRERRCLRCAGRNDGCNDRAMQLC